ncbi:MAG: diguanylate cyclase [Thermodesulfobacteriota bacterium]
MDHLSRAEGIRRGIEREVSAACAGERLKVTASLGVAAYPEHGQDVETLLAAADAALYRAKESGRNQVAVADG